MKTIKKPQGISVTDWKIARKKAEQVVAAYESGKPWDTHLYVGSKEFYELITDENGTPLFSEKATLKVAANTNTRRWIHNLIAEARSYLRHNLESAAQKTLQTLKRVAPTHPEVLLLLAYIAFRKKQYHNAWTLLCKLIVKDPRNAKAYFLRAQVLKKTGRTKDALVDVNMSLTASKPAQAAVMLKLELLAELKMEKQLEKTIATYQHHFTHLSFHLFLANLMKKTMASNSALSYLLSVSQHHENQPAFHLTVAQLARQTHHTSLLWKHAYKARSLGSEKGKAFWEALKRGGNQSQAA